MTPSGEASEARAAACGELVDLIHGALAAGVPCPLPQWDRDDMAEVQAIKLELANFVRAATDAGMPVLVWSPETTEVQGETWDEPRKGDG